jgi:hypothetical protein
MVEVRRFRGDSSAFRGQHEHQMKLYCSTRFTFGEIAARSSIVGNYPADEKEWSGVGFRNREFETVGLICG